MMSWRVFPVGWRDRLTEGLPTCPRGQNSLQNEGAEPTSCRKQTKSWLEHLIAWVHLRYTLKACTGQRLQATETSEGRAYRSIDCCRCPRGKMRPEDNGRANGVESAAILVIGYRMQLANAPCRCHGHQPFQGCRLHWLVWSVAKCGQNQLQVPGGHLGWKVPSGDALSVVSRSGPTGKKLNCKTMQHGWLPA